MSRYSVSYEFEIETDIDEIEVIKKHTLTSALDYANKILPFAETANVVVCVYRNLRLYDTMSVSEFLRCYFEQKESLTYKQSFDL